MSKEAMKLALEALEVCEQDGYIPVRSTRDAITALREALAKPDFWEGYVPEPVKPAQRPIKTFHGGKPWPVQEPAQQALDKMAENARELGLDYDVKSDDRLMEQPAQRKPLTITEESAWGLARYVYARSNPHESPQILLSAMEIKQIIEAAHGIGEKK